VISNGDHLVGTDIDPGVYRADVKSGIMELCSVSQRKEDGQIIDIRLVDSGSVIFTVADVNGSVVSFTGCENIGLASERIRTEAQLGNGFWLVGEELAPGQYRCTVDTESTFVLGSVTQYDSGGSIMDIQIATEGSVIFTVRDSAGSVVDFSGCSEIAKV
jgi:alpha-glucuronidase